MIKFVFAVLHVASVLASALERLDCMKTRTDAMPIAIRVKNVLRLSTLPARGARWPLDPYICVESDQCGNYFSVY